MNVVIYGLGKWAEEIRKMIEHNGHEIVAYSDSYSDIRVYMEKQFIKPGDLKNIKFDYIVIAVLNRKITMKIQEKLVCECNIELAKIVPLSIWEKSEIVENVRPANGLEGLVLGNSHARYGILTDYMSRKFINLACDSQDIYCNTKVYERFCDKYIELAKNIKMIIFDLYDYNYLNLDNSRTKGMLEYISMGGIKLEHNYYKNTNYNNDFATELYDEWGVILNDNENIDLIMKNLFGNHVSLIYRGTMKKIYDRYTYIDEKEPMPIEKFETAILTKEFTDTINENIDHLNKFVSTVKEISPECKIVFTLLPRYYTMEKYLNAYMGRWKKLLGDTIKKLQENGNVYFINFKECIEISSNNHFYYDIYHLNTLGGKCMTSMLNGRIEDILGEKINEMQNFNIGSGR